MDQQFPGGRLRFDGAALEVFNVGPSGVVARTLQDTLEQITQEAKRLSPVSPDGSHGRPSGYLRSHIGWRIERDGERLVGIVESTATSPTGAPYPLFQEVGWTTRSGNRGKHTPYLRPALERVRQRGIGRA